MDVGHLFKVELCQAYPPRPPFPPFPPLISLYLGIKSKKVPSYRERMERTDGTLLVTQAKWIRNGRRMARGEREMSAGEVRRQAGGR